MRQPQHFAGEATRRVAALDPWLGRRDLLRIGSLSMASTLTAASSAAPTHPSSARSVIVLWLGGGVTHIDSFDPKPDAPEEIRGTLDTVQTSLPGIQFAEPMPELARLAHELCVVRSFSHDSNDHLMSQVYTLSGRKVTPAQLFSEPNIGAIVSHLQGPRNGLPGYIAVPGVTRPGPPPHNLFVGGWLGNQYAPFCVGGQPAQPDFTVGEKAANPAPQCDEDLHPRELASPTELPVQRLTQRAGLRSQLEETLPKLERTAREATVDGNFEHAFRLLMAPEIRDAFDVTLEDAATRDAYGRTKIGGRCLLARRLVEAGARFVMVDYGYDPDYGNLWDIHNVASQGFPHVSEMCRRGYSLAGVDRAFAALLRDLRVRGLLESTLVVYLTEFGRTPKINSNGGRDHWGMCGSMFFAGGGVRGGQVIGESDAQGAWPITPPYGPADIAATLYRAIGIDPDQRLLDRQNRPHPVLDHGQVIPGVLA